MSASQQAMASDTSPSVESISKEALSAVAEAQSINILEELRVRYLGKKGSLTGLLKSLGGLAPDERKSFGQAVNDAKDALQQAIEDRKVVLEDAELQVKLSSETVDITLPVRHTPKGALHPIPHVIEEITTIFAELGFAVAEGPDIEDDFHNFTALNFPPEHPARQMHDTFFLRGEGDGERPVLRTHTSPVQIRAMKEGKLPLRCIAPGSTYRCDSDQTHTPMFHQVEGLAIGKDIHMGHLKGTIIAFLEAFFDVKDLPVRFRPSFFPFTEPSAEVDIGCSRKDGTLVIGEGDDWLEVLGCGMVHPNVLKNCDIDPEEWQGFAFGMGVERLAMLKYGIPDLRTFFDADIRWLKHYGFSALQ